MPTHLPARAPPGLARRRWLQRLEGLTWLKGTNRLKGLKGQRVSPWLAALTQELPRGWRRGHTDGVLALAKGGTLLYSGGYDHCIKVPRPWNRWVTLELFALPPREHAVLVVLAPPGPDETRSAQTKLNRTSDGPAAGQIWDAAAPDLAEAGAAGAAGGAAPLHLKACRLPPPAAPRNAPAPKA